MSTSRLNRETEVMQLILAEDQAQAETWSREAVRQLQVAAVLCASAEAARDLATCRLAELLRDAVYDELEVHAYTWAPARELSKTALDSVAWLEVARCLVSGVTGEDGSGCVPGSNGHDGNGGDE